MFIKSKNPNLYGDRFHGGVSDNQNSSSSQGVL